ncbi:MAG: class II aldolase/adducin family protein [Bacteriovoracaceae bacterium]
MNKPFEEGVIKFNLREYNYCPAFVDSFYRELETWREKLFSMKLIGEYQEMGVGYGNISCKKTLTSFLISGTQTGKFPHLDGSQYCLIEDCDLINNVIKCRGPIKPSSEALTHDAIYRSGGWIQFVFHVHDTKLWEYMIRENYPSTPESVDYGTIEMAQGAKACIGTKKSGSFVMKGHQDGIIAWGTNGEETFEHINEIYKLVYQK